MQQFLHIICRPRPHRRGAADHAVAVAIAMEVTAAGDQKAHAPRGQIQQGRGASGGPFQRPRMKLFSGMMTAVIAPTERPGTITVKATSPGLKKATVEIRSEAATQR